MHSVRLATFSLCWLLMDLAAYGQQPLYTSPIWLAAAEEKLKTLQRTACADELQRSKTDGVMPSTESAIIEATRAVSVNGKDGAALLCRASAWVMRASTLDEPRHQAHLLCKAQANAPGATRSRYSECMGAEAIRRRNYWSMQRPAQLGNLGRPRTTASVVRVLEQMIESAQAAEALFTADADIDRAIQAKADPTEAAPLRLKVQTLKLQLAEK
jgi:hypothetical protein